MSQGAPIYLVELCSGERRRWQLLSDAGAANPLWRDCETGMEFRESGLLYAWKILRKIVPGTSDSADM